MKLFIGKWRSVAAHAPAETTQGDWKLAANAWGAQENSKIFETLAKLNIICLPKAN